MEHGGIINSSAFFPNLYFDDIVKYIHDIKDNYSDEEPEKGTLIIKINIYSQITLLY